MAKSEVEICNIALQRVGVTATIDSMNQRIKEALVCNTVYDMVREKTLKDSMFPFSRKYSLLNLSGTAPIKWKFRYVYPTDCLAIRSIFPDLGSGYDPVVFRRVSREAKLPYEIVTDDTGEKTIVTDVENAAIEYTVNVTNPVRFDSAFVSMFAWGMAGEIALPLSRDVKYAQNAFAMYEKEKNESIASAMNEEVTDTQPESEFILVRN